MTGHTNWRDIKHKGDSEKIAELTRALKAELDRESRKPAAAKDRPATAEDSRER